MAAWMKVTPGKTERDWLLEERCVTEQQRSDLKRLLDLCDYLDVSYRFKEIDFMEELNDFCDKNEEDENITDFKEQCAGLIKEKCPVREYDLYFPSKRWVINIGEEDRDYQVQMGKNILDFSLEDSIKLPEYKYLYEKFINYLTGKYHYPSFDKETDSNKTYLPWTSGKLPRTMGMGWNIEIGSVSSFYHQLFGEDFEKAQKKSIEDFLASNPDLRKQRADMLHDHCKSLINDKKLELNNVEIRNLLNQVDKELASIYPAFKGAALM